MMFKICLDTNTYRDEHEKNDDTEMNGNWIDRMNGMNGWTGWTDERMKWTNRRKIQTEETEENTRPRSKTLAWPQTNFTADLFNLCSSLYPFPFCLF